MSSTGLRIESNFFNFPIVVCVQFSEDCLIMNVFTPLLNDTSTKIRLPVMIFIPGGSFQFLDASIPPYNAQRMVNTTNVICVFVQYRLGKIHTPT